MNLIASLGHVVPAGPPVESPGPTVTAASEPAPRRKGGTKKGMRFPPKKGGSTALIIEALTAAKEPMLAKDLAEATGHNLNAVSVALCLGTQKGDFVRSGSVKPFRYSLPRFE